MAKELQKSRSAVKREQAESYLLISLVAFALTVVGVRVFLEATGYPQIGNWDTHNHHSNYSVANHRADVKFLCESIFCDEQCIGPVFHSGDTTYLPSVVFRFQQLACRSG
ncbi:MAG: hypothetical protein AMJ56_21410 [Anaerolineae bacterium SG8_19]|jgi:hypothetical protein|nr:MAG: hypothetical protein AMJ56_21410 [Anaerolineae bacterium SG8_19]